MNILVIDDEREFQFHDMAYEVYRNVHAFNFTTKKVANNVLYVKTIKDAEWVLSNGWDIVYLDHDLGGEDVRTLTKEIEAFAHGGFLLNIGKFVIHSMNPLGRMEMYNALHKFYNVEFARVEDLL